MADYLNTLYLYGNVKIARDYSTVHDLSPSAWLTYLKTQTAIQTELVNYYRLPSVIRIEGRYDELRKATYGVLEGGETLTDPTFERPFFFWVDSVKLVKQASFVDTGNSLAEDVVELTISPDVWSNNNGQFSVVDTYVVRKHMDRWHYNGPHDYRALYYPDACDSVDGAFLPEKIVDLTPGATISAWNTSIDKRWIVVNVLDTNGVQHFFIGCSVVDSDLNQIPVYWKREVAGVLTYTRLMSLDDILDGSFYSEASVTADFVQSITVVPFLSDLDIALHAETYNGDHILALMTTVYSYWENHFDKELGTNFMWLSCDSYSTASELASGLYLPKSTTVSPVKPAYHPYLDQTGYFESNEPMLYRFPARQRKVVTGIGGTLIDVPDIKAFETTYTVQNLFDLASAVTIVFGGTDAQEANIYGNLGSMEAATLPIYNSAWKSYAAISKVGDEINFNSQQASTVANGAMNVATTAIFGALAGGPVGAAVGTAVAGLSIGVSMHGQTEALRAKQTNVRNSPCTVRSSGSGLGAMIRDLIDITYVTMKIDDVSFDKLKTQYYYYGYNLGEVVPGALPLNSRRLFDYIETRGAKITGTLNAQDAADIAAIFDHGVRIYHGTDGYAQIGAGMSLENHETSLLEYQ